MGQEELLDWYEADGRPGGIATRGAVHARGLWHRTLHLWLATRDAGGGLLYQLRSPDTVSWPGLLDVTVGGHLLAGEGWREALREAEEEIGLIVPSDAVTMLGVRRDGGGDAHAINLEMQGVHIALLDPAWGRFRPGDGEAAALVRVSNADGERLHGGAVDAVDALFILPDGEETRRIAPADFVPRVDDYYRTMHHASARLLRGDPLPSLGG